MQTVQEDPEVVQATMLMIMVNHGKSNDPQAYMERVYKQYADDAESAGVSVPEDATLEEVVALALNARAQTRADAKTKVASTTWVVPG